MSVLIISLLSGCKSNINDIITDESFIEENVDNPVTGDSIEENTSNSTTEDYYTEKREEYNKYMDYISAKDKNTVALDSESERLYSEFLSGHTSAEYDISGDTTRFFILSDVLEDGERYTLNEIIDKVKDGCEDVDDWHYEGNISEKYLDLGLDDTYELIVDIGAAYEHLTLVVKNIDGKLKICFAGDSSDNSTTTVLFSGEVHIYTTVDNDTHWGDSGFIDENGDYRFWGTFRQNGYNIGLDEELTYNDIDIGKGFGMYITEYSFDKGLKDSFYKISFVDLDNNELLEDDSRISDAYTVVSKLLEEEGKKVVTNEEGYKLVEEQRIAIGFSDDLYHYGDELKPEEY